MNYRTMKHRGAVLAVVCGVALSGLAPGAAAVCRTSALCAEEYTCAELEDAIRQGRGVRIEFVSGYSYSDGRGTVDFRTSCGFEEVLEPWKVTAKDGEICELFGTCEPKFVRNYGRD